MIHTFGYVDLMTALLNSREFEDRRPYATYCGRQFDGRRYCFLTNGHRGEHQDLPRDEHEALYGDTDATILATQAHASRQREETA